MKIDDNKKNSIKSVISVSWNQKKLKEAETVNCYQTVNRQNSPRQNSPGQNSPK